MENLGGKLKTGGGHSTGIQYRFTFRPGRYKYVDSAVTAMPQPAVLQANGQRCFLIGREEDGHTVAFTFEENEAMHICFGLNLIDAMLTGDTAAQKAIMSAMEKLKKQ